MKISIIICSRNRASSLDRTLRAASSINVPNGISAELVVVDNGSTDETADVTLRAPRRALVVRYIFEARLGKGYALNRGVRESNGDILLFTDDDVRPGYDWAVRMCEPIIRGSADAVSGNVVLARHLERPWLQGVLRGFTACTDWKTSKLGWPEMIGANMGCARRVFAKVPNFDVELGPGAIGFGEETLFSRQLVRAGFKIQHVEGAGVEHHFDPRRLCVGSFEQNVERIGRAGGYISYHWEHERYGWPLARHMTLKLKKRLRTLIGARVSSSDCPQMWRLFYLMKLGFWSQFATERKRRPNYEQFGLVKRSGLIDTSAE